MIKYVCDRCGKEIKNRIFYVNISSDGTQGLYNQSDYDKACNVRDVINSIIAMPEPRMYCETCMVKIKEFCEVNKE